MLRRTALAILSLFVMLNLFQHLTPKASAQAPVQQFNNPAIQQSNVNPYSLPNTNPDVPKNLHTYSQSLFLEILSAISCQLSGIDPISPDQKCLGIDVQNGKIGFMENSGGALGLAQKGIAMMFTIPIGTGDYARYLASNFGISKHAYAADASACAKDQRGIGFCGLSPIISIWAAFRNIAYLLFVLVFIAVGFAIMFRIKIDPRTVMTIENSLPRIVVSLVLITFSFAISGFLVDLMYVTIYASQSVLGNVDSGFCPPTTDKDGKPVDNGVNGRFPISYLQNNGPFEAANSLQKCHNQGQAGIFTYAGTIANELRPVIQKMIGIDSDFNLGAVGHILNPLGGITDLIMSVGNFLGSTPQLNMNPDTSRPSAADWVIDLISHAGEIAIGLKIANTGATLSGPLSPLSLPATATAGAAAGWAAYSMIELILRVFAPYLIVYLIVLLAVLWATFRLWYELVKAFLFVLIGVVFSPFWILAGAFPGENLGIGPWLRDIVANLSAFPVAITMFLLAKVFIDAFETNATFLTPPLIASFASNGQVIGSIISVGMILLTPQVVAIMKDRLKSPEFKFTAGIGQAVGVGASTPISTLKSVGGSFKEVKYNPYDPTAHKGGKGALWRLIGRYAQ